MEWYNKFKVGQEVRVVEKIQDWRFNGRGGATWVCQMDRTINKVFRIIDINADRGYLLNTSGIGLEWNYWYPVESLQEPAFVGEQLLFDFMSEAT